jgi:hypothetical protein
LDKPSQTIEVSEKGDFCVRKSVDTQDIPMNNPRGTLEVKYFEK